MMAELVPVDHDPFAQQTTPPETVPVDHDPFAAPSKGILAKAAEPITSYPQVYSGMQREARSTMGEGINQASEAIVAQPQTPAEKGQAAIDFAKGVGKTAMGGLGYVTAPIGAALRTVVGTPVEENTGIPKEYSEFAASLALPIPKKVPFAAARPVTSARSVEDLKAAAGAGYQSPEVVGLELKPSTFQDLGSQARAALNAKGFDENTTPVTMGILSRLADGPPGSIVTGQNIRSLQRTLGKAAGKSDPSERAAAVEAMDHISEWLGNMHPSNVLAGDPKAAAGTIAEANGNYSAAMRSEKISGAVKTAEENAGAANSGSNTENAMRQRIKAILQSPNQRKGYSQEELTQMGKIVRGTYTGDVVRAVGNLLGGGGGLGTVVVSGLGAATSGSNWGIALPALGFGFKRLGSVLTSNQIAKLDEMVRARAPLTRPLVNWSNAAQEFEVSPTPRNIARLSLASKNLSNNLPNGISLSPQDLLKSISGPVRAPAEQEQP